MFLSAWQEHNCRLRDHHCSCTLMHLAFTASQAALHVIQPKALISAPAAWPAMENNQIYLEQLLGEVSASIESLQVANEVRAGHSLPNILGESGGEKHRDYLWDRGRCWLEQVPQPRNKHPISAEG